MTPIKYEWTYEPRFSELDMYGHVNVKNLVDYVMASRHAFFRNRWKLTAKDILSEGYAVVTTKMTFNFRRGADCFSPLRVESYVEKIIGPILKIPFKVTIDGTGETVLDGHLEQVYVDTVTKSALDRLPENITKYFYE